MLTTNELKDAIKALPLKELAEIIKSAFEEKAAFNENISTIWQKEAFIGQLNRVIK